MINPELQHKSGILRFCGLEFAMRHPDLGARRRRGYSRAAARHRVTTKLLEKYFFLFSSDLRQTQVDQNHTCDSCFKFRRKWWFWSTCGCRKSEKKEKLEATCGCRKSERIRKSCDLRQQQVEKKLHGEKGLVNITNKRLVKAGGHF